VFPSTDIHWSNVATSAGITTQATNSQFVFSVGGVYQLTANVMIDPSSVSTSFGLLLNGSAVPGVEQIFAPSGLASVTAIFTIAPGDVLEFINPPGPGSLVLLDNGGQVDASFTIIRLQ